METPRLDLIRLSSTLATIARGALVVGLAGVLLSAACAGGNDGTGTGGSSGGGTTGGSAAGTSGGGGTAGTGVAGTTGIAGTSAGSGGSTGVAGTGGATAGSGGSGGSPAGTAGSGGSTGVAGTGGATAGTGGGNAGRGGNAGGAAGAAGRGGASGSGTAGSGAGGSSGSGGPPACPANATFCSGFESAGLPTGAIYRHNGAPGEWTRDYAIDSSQKNSGNSSLRVKLMTESGVTGAYRMLAVPGTPNAFWVRFFVRSNMPMGGEHNAFAMASLNEEPNNQMSVEFAEDVGISFNASDVVRWPTGYGRLQSGATNPYVLPANTWHCVEVSFDGPNRIQQLFVNGMQLINAPDYPATTRAFTFFKFGLVLFHGPDRQMWYDDVAVAPTRIGGCP
jgi:hypothetical protein